MKRKRTRIKIRKRWQINPKTRVKESNKLYKRTRERTKLHKDLRENK